MVKPVKTETELAVAAYLDSLGVQVKFEFVPKKYSRNKHQKELCINWMVCMERGNKTFTTAYTLGIGHAFGYSFDKKNSYEFKTYLQEIAEKGTGRLQTKHAGLKRVAAPKPKLDDLFHSLLWDMESGYQDFEEFCDNLGLNTDSIKDRDIWLSCQKIRTNLEQMFSEEELDRIQDIVKDL